MNFSMKCLFLSMYDIMHIKLRLKLKKQYSYTNIVISKKSLWAFWPVVANSSETNIWFYGSNFQIE